MLTIQSNATVLSSNTRKYNKWHRKLKWSERSKYLQCYMLLFNFSMRHLELHLAFYKCQGEGFSQKGLKENISLPYHGTLHEVGVHYSEGSRAGKLNPCFLSVEPQHLKFNVF